MYRLVEALVNELGRRESATVRELRAAGLLRDRFEQMGYAAEIQPFEFRYFDFARWSRSGGRNAAVVVQSPRHMRLTGLPLTTSPNDTSASGTLVALDLNESTEILPDGLEGKVVHVLFGDLDLGVSQVMQRLQDQVDALANAGAAAVLFSRKQGEPTNVRVLYGVDSPIPALIVTTEEGRLLQEVVASGGEVVLEVKIEAELLESRNVIAELRGSSDDLVIVGAHYDTVLRTDLGANDNASGIAAVLSLSEALAGQSLPFTVRFVLFGAEELGLYGSRHYVASLTPGELARTVAMLNFDVVGTGPWLAALGDQRLINLAARAAGNLGIEFGPSSLPPGASSDHQPFREAGVPVLMLYATDLSRIHSPQDRLEYVQPERLGEAFLVAHALLQSTELARSDPSPASDRR